MSKGHQNHVQVKIWFLLKK